MVEETTAADGDGPVGSRPSRRQLLRAGVNLATGGAIARVFGTELLSREGLGTITYALARTDPGSPGLEPRRREVSVGWHRSLLLAFEVHRQLHDNGLSRLVDSFVLPGSDDDPTASLAVRAPESDAGPVLADLTAGLPVEFEVLDGLLPKPYDEFDPTEAYHAAGLADGDVPGGVLCHGGDHYGTLAPALVDVETGRRLFATSNHLYGAGGTHRVAHRGTPLEVPDDEQRHRVGVVSRGYPAADIATVEPVPGYRPRSVVERATPARVIGQYTKAGLAHLMARGESLTKFGAASDRTSGRIKGIDGVTCYTGRVCKPGQLKWGGMEQFTDGDSGSVAVHADPEHPDDYLLVAGLTNARSRLPVVDFAWGTAGHQLLDAHGLHF